jgi:rhamnosyltransferase
VYDAQPERDRIAILAMSHRDRATGRDYHHGKDIIQTAPLWRSVRATITSGSLVKTAVFERAGFFDESLFIDSVDHDFCLRCRAHGMLVIEGREQIMEHSIGAATEHRFLGRRIPCTNHSPLRRYYITRNTLEVSRRYLFRDFLWTAFGLYYFLAGNILILLFEADRAAKLRAMAEGTADFLRRRFGPKAAR